MDPAERADALHDLGKRYVGSTAVLLWGTASAQGMLMVATLLTARQLGTSAYGQYAACFAASALTSVVFDLGLDTWLLREGAHKEVCLQELVGSALLIKCVAGIPWIVAMALLAPKLNPATFPMLLVGLSAVAVWLDGLFMAGLSGLKAAMRNGMTALFLFVSRGTLLGGIVVLMYWGHGGTLPYALARVVAAGVGVLLVFVCPGLRIPRLALAWLWRVGREALPYALSAMLVMVYMRVDVTIIAIALDAHATGLYSAASGLVNALFFIPGTISSVAIPALVRAFDSQDRDNVGHLLVVSLSALALVGCVLSGGVRLWGDSLLVLLLGNEFAEAGSILAILSPILFLKSLSFGLAALLVAGGWQYRRAGAQALPALANAGLNILIVHQYGTAGVARVYVLSEMILLLGYAILGRRWWRAWQGRHIHKGMEETGGTDTT